MDTKENPTHFSYEAYEKLIEKIGTAAAQGNEDAIADAEALRKAFNSFSDYVITVAKTETEGEIARLTRDKSAYRFITENNDLLRKVIHDGAMANVALVNNLVRFYGVETPVFSGDKFDRYQVADFCLEVTRTIFNARKL